MPDTLHHFQLGIIKKTINYALKANPGKKAAWEKALHKVSIRSLKKFKLGILDAKCIKAWEYIDLLFLFTHATYEVDLPDVVNILVAMEDVLIQLRLGDYNVCFALFFHFFAPISSPLILLGPLDG